MARLPLLVLAASVLQCCSAQPFKGTSKLEKAPEPKADLDMTLYRLPTDYEAVDYKITLKPYFKTGDSKEFTFDGIVVMRLKPLAADLSKLVLHSNGLVINHADVRLTKVGDSTPVNILFPLVFTDEYDFLTLSFVTALDANAEYELTFSAYTGTIREEMEGFYRSSYEEGGVTKWLGTTQFQPVSARKVFPCLDEPQFKATFTLTIVRPASMKSSLSNMPVNKDLTTQTETEVSETFYETPKMSTYLLAFIVSEFEAAGQTPEDSTKPFGIWARPEAKTMGTYPFETGQKLVASMDEYTGVEYYGVKAHMKMDQAAIPDFSAGAMENWGLLTYREAILMFDETESSAKYRQQINSIMAHEIAHMWFGDLVTTHWWSDTWLNEGFATFFQYILPDMHDEDMDMSTQFVLAQLQTALLADATLQSTPMTNDKVNSPDQIDGHFSTISYNKGGSVLRMIENWIGPETFKKALNRYLIKMSLKSAQPADLFLSLDEAAAEDQSLSSYPDGTNVASVMESWTSQAGYPLLYVDINYEAGTMNLTQSRMVSYGETTTAVLYKIPITYATETSADFENTKPDFVMDERHKLIEKTKGHEWVVFNKKQTGFYRVNYDDHSWVMLTSALSGDSRTDIHTLNRAQIVDDVLNLARENITNYVNALNVVEFLSSESDYAPWTAAITGFNAIRRRFATVPDTLPNLDKHILYLLENVITTLGLEEGNDDDHLTKIFRANTLTFACMLGHAECLEDASSQLEALLVADTSVNPNLREHVYCNGLRRGNATHYNFLWSKFLSDNVINEKLVILSALGCTKDEESLTQFLEQTIIENSPIRRQDLMTAYNSALGGNDQNVETVFNFIKSNTAAFVKAYGSSTSTAINSLIGRMKGTQLQRVLVFLRSSENELSDSAITRAISAVASAGANFEWAMFHKATVDDWLELKYSGSAAITSSLALIITMLAVLLKN